MQAAEAGSGGALERFFKFKQWDTSIKRDTLAGLATFMVMAYIIFVNPNILGLGGAPEGLPFAAALTSTCLVAGVMTILMGLVTNRAYAIAPGMGLNAVVAFSLVLGQGLTMANAMGLVVLEGIAILILVLTGFREAIFKAIPLELKKAIVIGIGFFILFIGLVDGGLINVNGGTPVGLVDLSATAMVPLAVSVFGLVITIIMLALRWRAAILLGIIFATVFAIIMNYAWGQNAGFLPGQAVIPSDILAMPDFSLVGAFDFGAFGKLGVTAAVLWIFSLMLSDFFDTMGTLVGVGGQAGYLDKKGDLPQVNRALLVDSVAAAAGGAVSASSATTYIESGAGVAQGGRTGWVAIVVGVLFLIAMFFSPIFGVVPGQATAAALVIVGLSHDGDAHQSRERGRARRLRAQGRHQLRQPGLRPAGGAHHHDHAAHLQHHERHRRRLHRLHHHPCGAGQGARGELDALDRLRRFRDLLHLPLVPGTGLGLSPAPRGVLRPST